MCDTVNCVCKTLLQLLWVCHSVGAARRVARNPLFLNPGQVITITGFSAAILGLSDYANSVTARHTIEKQQPHYHFNLSLCGQVSFGFEYTSFYKPLNLLLRIFEHVAEMFTNLECTIMWTETIFAKFEIRDACIK